MVNESIEQGGSRLTSYFPENESIFSKVNGHTEAVVAAIVNRYIGSNPPHPVTYRAYPAGGFTRLSDYRYDFRFDGKFPDCRDGQFIYAWGKIWQETVSESPFALNCYGPLQLYLNGDLVYRSTIVEELDPDRRVDLRFKLQKGWNHFVLRFMKTASGIGGVFGTGSFKRYPLHFLSPTAEREGQEGWIFTPPLDGPLTVLPKEGCEAERPCCWLPQAEWPASCSQWQMTRMFGNKPEYTALAWTKVKQPCLEPQELTLSGECQGKIEVLVNDEAVFHAAADQVFRLSVTLPFGEHDVTVKSTCTGGNWGFLLTPDQEGVELVLPFPVMGAKGEWLFLGPLDKKTMVDAAEAKRLVSTVEGAEEKVFWRLDRPNLQVRPYLENHLFGKWDYPLGVTLYGLLEAGKALKRQDVVDYVMKHIEIATSLYKYSLWDKEQYGAAGVNHQLSSMDSLDDCGSFGATMLLAGETTAIRDAAAAAKVIANHITKVQDRLADGTLYRRFGSVAFMRDTIWCDDLYMSTPFLCRYFQKTRDISYLDDAVKQFLHYKKYMYLPESNIMSHVYDLKFAKATNVPWGRGNGWVLFSLSELLAVLPEAYKKRKELLTFFRELSAGYLRLQGTHGMWHQVLTDPESYEETSCTSMFVYAFSRGIRLNWLEEKAAYVSAVMRGWEGINRMAVDCRGNVYGVCQGSGYSFTADYYKHDLSWLLNDTHGIGIVLLAGIETMKLKKWLERAQRQV
ncbi:Rhamnogalacturonyl hydrolase YesR [Evansella caseinilytica]|uniref:Rhamnogalacturonyl hydrolase YesR n=1 Tax=Evansella caseinilytica TaxID=1503961 RepID=A0A1H3GJB2_9BACI|nr:glycoside hydrolase family 88 protein [Evansella caseinilytica]SDY03406.1 Rhamnogalacturonyl hydrolase YesR [Evansella caseinilytica]